MIKIVNTYRGESTHSTCGIDDRDSRLGPFLVWLAPAAFQAESILFGWCFQSVSTILNNIMWLKHQKGLLPALKSPIITLYISCFLTT